jgi:predicted  nucleic acid-binding Zn-ribbon protein
MSIALRIFIVLVLVMTLAFMFIQMSLFATRDNWKRRWDQDTQALSASAKDLSTQVATESALRVKAEAYIAQLQAEAQVKEGKLSDLEGQITERSAKIVGLERDLARAQADFNGLKEDNQAISTSLDGVRKRNGELTTIASVARAVAFNLNVKLAEIEDDYNSLQTEHSRTLETISKQETDLKKANAFVSQAREKFPEVYGALADESGSTERLRGLVAAVRPNPQGQADFVSLSIGSDEGVKEGQEFIVYRDSSYICRVRVERVMADMAHARVVPSSWNTNGLTVQVNDSAANNL